MTSCYLVSHPTKFIATYCKTPIYSKSRNISYAVPSPVYIFFYRKDALKTNESCVIFKRFNDKDSTPVINQLQSNDGLPEISKMKYRNRIPEPGTTISGFADNKKKN
jgi:hypothetical protein